MFQWNNFASENWSSWIEFRLRDDATIDTTNLHSISRKSGVYAIGRKIGRRTEPLYIGRTKNKIRDRVKSHLTIKLDEKNPKQPFKSRGSKGILNYVMAKKDNPSIPFNGFYVAFYETNHHVLVEQRYIKSLDPLANIQGALELPEGLTHKDILESPLDE
jgi:hypothetical protein